AIQATYCLASAQDTLITGCWPRPQGCSSFGSHPPCAAHASHSSNVISNLPTAKGCAIVTRCCGPSLALRPTSFAGDPIMKVPAGTTTISGQLAHSLNLRPGCSACSACVVNVEVDTSQNVGSKRACS